MLPALQTWYVLFGLLMTKRDMTLAEAVEWCKPFEGEQVKLAYEKYEETE